MILSKMNLAIVMVTSPDKNNKFLDNVHVTEEGATIASNGRVVLAVSPVPPEVCNQVPLNQQDVTEEFTIPSSGVKEIVKNIPNDTTFGGLLEYCDITCSERNVTATITDGKRNKVISCVRYTQPYIDYKTIFKQALAGEIGRVWSRKVINLKRMLSILNTIGKICPDMAGELPVVMDINENGDIVFRAINHKNGQQVLGVMSTYKKYSIDWLKRNKWVLDITNVKTGAKRKTGGAKRRR